MYLNIKHFSFYYIMKILFCYLLNQSAPNQVREAEKRVRDLEEEKHKLDDELKTHVERTRRVNIGQEVTFLLLLLLLVFLLLQLMALILILWSLLWVLGLFMTFMIQSAISFGTKPHTPYYSTCSNSTLLLHLLQLLLILLLPVSDLDPRCWRPR